MKGLSALRAILRPYYLLHPFAACHYLRTQIKLYGYGALWGERRYRGNAVARPLQRKAGW